MRYRRTAIGALVATLVALALAAPGAARAQQDHDHDLDHDHGHGGFPEYVDVFSTHHAYLERKLHPRVQSTFAEEGAEYEGSLELAWQFTDRLGAEIHAGFARTAPDVGDGVSGFGDVELAPMVALVQDPGRLLIVTARSGFVLPTGDEDDGLGIDGWGWEPGLLAWKGFGAENRGALQGELTYDRVFADEGPDEEALVYNLALSWWLPSNLIPIVEINGVTPLGDPAEDHHHDEEEEEVHAGALRGALTAANGDAEVGGDTTILGTVGFHYGFANGQQWGAGLQVPMVGDDVFDLRLVAGGIIHID